MNYSANEIHVLPEAAHDEATELYELAGQLKLLWRNLQRSSDSCPEAVAVHNQQHWVLKALSQGPRKMSDLAGCAHTSQASLTGIVDRLEEHGLVERMRSADDRRVVEVSITDAGRASLKEWLAAMLDRLGQMFAGLSPTERTELLRLLRLLIDSNGAT